MSNLAGARIAETTGPQSDVFIAGDSFDPSMVDQITVWIMEIDSYRSTAVGHVSWTVDPD